MRTFESYRISFLPDEVSNIFMCFPNHYVEYILLWSTDMLNLFSNIATTMGKMVTGYMFVKNGYNPKGF